MERKIKIIDLMHIDECLKSKLLPVSGTGLGYHINKNMVIITRKIKEHREVLKTLQGTFLIKNEKGENQYFKLKKEGHNFIPEVDEKGDYLKATDKDTLKDYIIDDTNTAYLEAAKAWEEDELSIDLFEFPADKVQSCIENNKFDGVDITPLLGILID